MSNDLIHETSPYLLQHAHNPVAWRTWGDAAFAEAKQKNQLVFLSIGYSTCHWCHVMERECFENEWIAGVMNHHFVNIKVDREERPDIDATYMAFVQSTTGHGGWPMSVWLTPEGKPVAGGTYFPPEDRGGRAGFPKVCHELGRMWRDDRAKIEASAVHALSQLQEQARGEASLRGLPDKKIFGDFLDRCESMFDEALGGFGPAPKFPRPVVLRTLMQMSERFGIETPEGSMAWEMSRRTLLAMAAGGMQDHLGGGFHRYSVDRYWHIPHYEKMLYDQAQLLYSYADAWQISKDKLYQQTAENICHYLIVTLRDAGGAFHAAEDADSLPEFSSKEKLEGAFWTWTAREISSHLDPETAAIFSTAYGVKAEGNARPESDPHGELDGRNTLYLAVAAKDLSKLFDYSENEILERLGKARQILLAVRSRRPLPHRDDKIVTAWNGLAIGALAHAAAVWARPEFALAARECAEFLKEKLWDGRTLYRSFRGKRGGVCGFPADYVFLISGLIDLHRVDAKGNWLAWASELQGALDENFWDAGKVGYVMKAELAGTTLMTMREDYDGAEPSPNHMAAQNLLKLAELCDLPVFAKRAEALLRAGSRVLETQSFAAPVLLVAMDLHERGVMKFQIPSGITADLSDKLQTTYFPRAIFTPGEGHDVILCEGQTCRIFL